MKHNALFFRKLREMSQKLSSAAALRVNYKNNDNNMYSKTEETSWIFN